MINDGVPHWFADVFFCLAWKFGKGDVSGCLAFLDPLLISMEFSVVLVSPATSVVRSAFSSDSMKIRTQGLKWSTMISSFFIIPVSSSTSYPTNASLIAYCLPSNVVLMFLRASSRLETDRPTAVFRMIDPLMPVSPACSDPIAMMR